MGEGGGVMCLDNEGQVCRWSGRKETDGDIWWLHQGPAGRRKRSATRFHWINQGNLAADKDGNISRSGQYWLEADG